MNENDLRLLQITFKIANQSRAEGNHPFGALLAGPHGEILIKAGNTTQTENDPTAHAETNLIKLAAKTYDRDFLAKCTLVASTEPCPMCAGAIFWSNIRRVVYGLSQEGLYSLTNDKEEALFLSCREVFARGKKPIEVIGPLLEEQAKQAHIGFWV